MVPYLFTAKQVALMKKYLNKAKLTNTEKACLYSTIKRKAEALSLLQTEFYITGQHMKTTRIEQAKEILTGLGAQKAFISGTFLFAEQYNDIDVFIVGKKRKQYHKDNLHFVCITENDLHKPIFISAAGYSVANFYIEEKKSLIQRPTFNDLTLTYEMAVNEVLEKEDQKTMREIIFAYHMHIKRIILDSYHLYQEWYRILELTEQEKIDALNLMTKELLHKLYSFKYLYHQLLPFIKNIQKLIAEYKANQGLIIFHKLFTEVKNDCRKTQV